ncbi:endolytic transglycosylase MltG [Cytophagaceae bacterium ABcell3]|nr:endolytic transglycosylase MltG [Cytophagaceae bacterium ABcell3]
MIRKKSPTFLAGVILTFAIVCITFTFYFWQIFFSPNFALQRQEGYVYIHSGDTFKDVMHTLENEGLLHDKLSFAFISKILGYQEKVKPGRYQINKKENNLTVVRRLRSGEQTPVRIIFNNIRLKEDLAKRLGNNLELSHEEILNKLNDPELTSSMGFDTTTIVSMFIPDTYEMFWTVSAEKLINRMHSEYKRFWNDERLAKAEAIGLSPTEVSILASIVEAETKMNDEKPRVAGVYINRLNKNMLLQADPTVVFATGDFGIKRVYKETTKIDSPYNTYMYPGLPPGPINIPSRTSLDAVLNYEKHNYLYFCAAPDFSGYHVFAKTYNEHLRNARKYSKALNQSNIR